MTRLFTDGLDMYNGVGTQTGLQAKWVQTSADGTSSLVAGRFGGQALQLAVSSMNANRESYSRAFSPAQGLLTYGFAWRCTSGFGDLDSNNAGWIAATTSGGALEQGLVARSDGSVRFVTGSTTAPVQVASSSTGLIVANTWYFFEVVLNINATTGYVEIYKDGTLIASATGIDTLDSSSTVSALELSCGTDDNLVGSATFQFDDVYVDDGGVPLGPSRVETLRATADGVVTWTPLSGGTNALMVDETTVDGDTTYNSSGVIGDGDLYDFGNLSSTPALIHSVNVVNFGRKTDAAVRTLYNAVLSGATASNGAVQTLSSTYSRYDRLLDTDPDTGVAWTPAGVNALQAGPKVAS